MEYTYHLNDSFSPYIKFPLSSTLNIEFGNDCSTKAIVNTNGRLRRNSLKTIGTHGFLTSPEACKRVPTKISFGANYPEVTLSPTYRQLVSLMSILDLHARVLRAHDWNSSVRSFNAWFSERRVDLSADTNDLLDILITDLNEIRNLSLTMKATASHLICLLVKGTLPREMICNYNIRPKSERAHEFLIRYVFYFSPSQTLANFADLLFKRFAESTPAEGRLDVSFTIENTKHSYAICPYGEKSSISKQIAIPEGMSEDLDSSMEEDNFTTALPITPQLLLITLMTSLILTHLMKES